MRGRDSASWQLAEKVKAGHHLLCWPCVRALLVRMLVLVGVGVVRLVVRRAWQRLCRAPVPRRSPRRCQVPFCTRSDRCCSQRIFAIPSVKAASLQGHIPWRRPQLPSHLLHREQQMTYNRVAPGLRHAMLLLHVYAIRCTV